MKYGDFGPAKKEVSDAAGGHENYNVETTIAGNVKMFGIVNEAGTEITSLGMSNSVEVMRWLTKGEVEKLKENRDDFDAPRSVLALLSIPLFLDQNPAYPPQHKWIRIRNQIHTALELEPVPGAGTTY